ncbi:hypothetical protein Poli38472_013227 [Pythium oligandrum]|uniref:ubiquitinyl hydrolase 1 n=1 Tax=Pythium oligandrum TaxID=41045 RepID=A0A8K1FAR5_PYTOL|nr:hypothetical protein Poli38472_013227 [Pythium oligandrum]|eukprot:TMW55336.1 hypothetical protein Poli38472_013227 [Pythium oligandrum]
MDTAVLNEIFRFKDQEPSSLQTPSLCETQMERVVACVAHELSKPAGNTAKRKCNNSCEDDSGPQKRSPSVDEFSTSERDVLTRVLKDWQSSYSEALPAPIRGDVWCVRWLPEYAAVLQLVCPCAGVVHFRILALDEWKRVIHLLPNERSVSSAVPTTTNVLNCGELAVEMIHEFIKALDHELLEATKRVGSKRSAAHGEQPGHQKTPTFMQYLVRAAIAATTGVERQFLPQGGMTDVGMHTGGLPRDTCWPLVCAVIRHSLPKVLCEKVLLVFRCRLLETELVILKKADDRVDRRSEVCFQMLENIVESVDNFGMSGGNVASMVAKCENWRLEIDSALKRVNEQVESKYALPTPSELESLPESARFPKLYSPTAHDQESNSTRPDDIGALARQQVEGFEFIDPTACTPEELIQFLVKMAPSGRTAVLGMQNIEAFMWQQAKMLAPKVSASEVTASHLWRLVEWYRDHLKVLSTEPPVHAVSSVDDQSFRGECTSDDELHDVCELVVLFHNSLLFASDERHAKTIEKLNRYVAEIVSRRILHIVDYVMSRDSSSALSALCRLANARFPENLDWSPLKASFGAFTSSFEATDVASGQHYLLNLATGMILTDGNPPSSLPPRIRDVPRYIDLFGDKDFEVTHSSGVFSTVYSTNGCFYNFAVDRGDLIVEESSEDGAYTIQLCSSQWIDDFNEAFPDRLTELHSHWYCPQQDCVLLRGRQIDQKTVFFVVEFDKDQALCAQVPTVDQLQLSMRQIVQKTSEYSVFVAPIEPIVRIFSKFEDARYIHFLSASEGVLEIELPRAELSFFVREGRIYSKNYCDYVLASNQQLHDGFSRFHRHLVLQSCAFRSQRRIVVPFGTVVVRDDGMTDVLLSEDSSDHFSTAVFDEHPRLKVLVTESIESRLLLVVIYAASGRFVPSKALSMTGGEAAIELLRGCTPSRPLSSNSMKQLRDLFRWTHRTPALKLLAALLIRKSCRLSFLYDNTDNNKTQDDKIDCCAEQDEYETICRRKRKNELCQLLTRAEEREYFGIDVPWHADIAELADSQLHELKGVPVPNTFVAEVEDDLSKLVTTDEPEEMMHVFPFDRCELNVMGDHMMAELEESWESHHTHPQRMLAIIPLSALLLKLNAARECVAFKRGLLDKYLAQAVQASQSNWCERLWRVVNRVPTPTKVDLIRSVVDKTLLVRLVPKLTIQSQRLFHEATLRMMELCVLEDKIERLIHAARAKLPPPPAYFVEELLAHRGWSTLKHPYWLVFEVEAELQIRPEQFIIAQHLIRNPSSVCQLNMGRGKTRVILPMLFLYFSHDRAVQRSSRVVRAHFLGSLLSETRQFMHRSLTAGILRLPMLEQPFERKVSLELMDVLRMQEAIDEIKRTGGVLTVAAEHRLSLELKYLELTMLTGKTSADKSPLAMALKQLMSNDQFIDVFDESDVMLHHKYHLVYSVQTKSTEGRSTSKPSEEMRERWLMAEALLSTLSNPASKRVRAVLDSSTDFWCVEMEYSDRPGGFNGIRFRSHADSDTVEVFWNKLRVALVEDMVSQAPFDLLWLQVLATHAPQFRDLLNNMVCDVSVDPERILSQMPRGVRVNQLLALRGLLAFGVLEHCLEKRNRVSFGLPQPGTRTKALAIPFKAADIPSDRAEFSHPDVGIALTLLAYYHAGLRDNEVHKSFEMLLRLDVSEQESYYTAWFESVKTSLSPEEQQQLGSVNNLVLDDVALMARLCQVYRFSMEVVNFYLNRSVFPRDTYQFPHRLARSAWDLVKGSSNIGFSGTNDNHRLLPLAVTQQGPDNPSLKGTNGKMLDLMIGHSRGYVVLKTARNTRLPVWKTLLLTALTKKCRALIDTGALLAGIPTHGAAMFLIEQSDSFSGVTYYDTRDDYDCWVVLDVVRRVITPLKSSAIHERDTFVVFDEARSRGSDMKLLPDACAMLTLGPKMTKDKLMQGAGRMRQLGCDQTLWLTSTDEVQQSIQRVTRSKTVNLDVRSVLKWVVTCTQEQCTLGLLEWANSAVEFCTKESDSSME